MKVKTRNRKRLRQTGLTLVEVATAISVFTVIALAVGFTLIRGMEHRRHSQSVYEGLVALRDTLADIQETANKPQNLAASEGIGAVYGKYNNANVAVPSLVSGNIRVVCFPNEATVPTTLGGPQDLNFDGDAADDHGNLSAGTDMKLVPMTLTLTFGSGNTAQTIVMSRLVTKTTD